MVNHCCRKELESATQGTATAHMLRVQLSGLSMAALNTAPDDLAVPYDAPRQQSMVAMAQPNAPKKDCSQLWSASLMGMQASPKASVSKDDRGQRTAYTGLGV